MKYTAQLTRHLVLKKESSFKHWNFRLLHIFTMVTDVFIYIIITICCCYVSVPTITKPCSWQCWCSKSFSQIWFVIIQKYRLKRKLTPNHNYHHCCCRLWFNKHVALGAELFERAQQTIRRNSQNWRGWALFNAFLPCHNGNFGLYYEILDPQKWHFKCQDHKLENNFRT